MSIENQKINFYTGVSLNNPLQQGNKTVEKENLIWENNVNEEETVDLDKLTDEYSELEKKFAIGETDKKDNDKELVSGGEDLHDDVHKKLTPKEEQMIQTAKNNPNMFIYQVGVQPIIAKSLDVDKALGIESSEDLEDKTGEELFDMYTEYNEQYGDNDWQHIRKTGALIKLLGEASEEQLQGFFDAYKDEYGQESFENGLGSLMMWSSYSKEYGMVSEEEYNKFMQTAMENPDLFPQGPHFYGGISSGIQYL